MSAEDIVYIVVDEEVEGPEAKLQPLFPIGAHNSECDLTLGWSRDSCVLRSPGGACFEMEQQGASACYDG